MSDDLNDFARSLKSLEPTGSLSQNTLMFEAGKASARAGWRWPVATFVSSLVAATLAAALFFRSTPEPIERIVYVPAPAPQKEAPPRDPPRPEPPSDPPLVPTELVQKETPRLPASILEASPPYRHLQDQVLRWGLDGLPPLRTIETSENSNSLENLLESL